MWYVYYSTFPQKGKMKSGDEGDQLSMAMTNKTGFQYCHLEIKSRLKSNYDCIEKYCQ